MSGPDARMWAWIQAWDHLEAATKVQEKHGGKAGVDAAVDKLHRTAELYAALADVPETVGIQAAELLQQRKEQDEQQRRMMKDFMSEFDVAVVADHGEAEK